LVRTLVLTGLYLHKNNKFILLLKLSKKKSTAAGVGKNLGSYRAIPAQK